MTYIKVKGHNHLIRDPETNSIINTNMSEYKEYISRRDSKLKENEKVNNLESDVANMKDDLNEIKNLLRSLLNESR
jgi:tetrahydromethanopterin S-methyltransferase subunit B